MQTPRQVNTADLEILSQGFLEQSTEAILTGARKR